MKNKFILSAIITTLFVFLLSFSSFASQSLDNLPVGNNIFISNYDNVSPITYDMPYPEIGYFNFTTEYQFENVNGKIISIDLMYLETFAINNDLVLPTDMTLLYPFIHSFNIDYEYLLYDTTFINIEELENACKFILMSLSNNGNEELQNQITALNNQITSLNGRIQELENEIIDKDEQIERWHDLYISYLNSYNDALRDIEELENDLVEKNNDYNTLYQRFISAENQIVSLNAEIIQLEQELEDALNNATSYQDGYNQALEDYDIFNSGLASIFSAPMYIVNSIFGFEIFGFNFFTVIQFILSLVLIIWLFEKMR